MRRLPQFRAPGAASGDWFGETGSAGDMTGADAVADSVSAPVAWEAPPVSDWKRATAVCSNARRVWGSAARSCCSW